MKVSGPGHREMPNYSDIFQVIECISISSWNNMQNTAYPEWGNRAEVDAAAPFWGLLFSALVAPSLVSFM